MEQSEVREMDTYQDLAMRTANHGLDRDRLLSNVGLGLAGEAGEVADMIKKHLHQGHPLDEEKLKKELGDIMWYIALGATLLDIPLSVIATANIEKLAARYPKGFSSVASQNRRNGDG